MSPTTVCSRNAPSPPPTTTKPVAMPMRTESGSCRARLEPCNSGNDVEPCAHGSLGIVLVRAGIAEIGQYPVAPEIGKEAVKGYT